MSPRRTECAQIWAQAFELANIFELADISDLSDANKKPTSCIPLNCGLPYTAIAYNAGIRCAPCSARLFPTEGHPNHRCVVEGLARTVVRVGGEIAFFDGIAFRAWRTEGVVNTDS